jgi:hypothetical protein
MTPEEKRAMTVELATKVMGWRVEHQEHIIIAIGLDKDGLEFRRIIWRARNRISLLSFWTPTENMGDAWALVEALEKKDWRLSLWATPPFGYRAKFFHESDVRIPRTVEGPTAPLAICMAALEAVR